MYIIQYIIKASIVVKIDILILFILSILVLAVFFNKNKRINLINKYNEQFEKTFWSEKISLEDFYNANKNNLSHPMGIVFSKIMQEWIFIHEVNLQRDSAITSIKDRMSDSVLLAKIKIDKTLKKYQSFLLTTISLSPLLGLFGTICGIINTFYMIGLNNNANINTLAPGIAEALIVTGLGLFVAICAAVLYNYFNSEISEINDKIDIFALDLLSILFKEIDKMANGEEIVKPAFNDNKSQDTNTAKNNNRNKNVDDDI